MSSFKKLKKIYKDYDTSIETKNGYDIFTIKNPHWNENITIDREIDDASGELTVYFSFQHAHFSPDFPSEWYQEENKNYFELAVEYINDFLHGKRVAVEFFIDGSSVFGGDECRDEIDMLSGEEIFKRFAQPYVEAMPPFNMSPYFERMKGYECRCSIRGWNDAHNKDLDFVVT